MTRFSNVLFVLIPDFDCGAAFAQALNTARDNQAKLTVVGCVDDVNPFFHRMKRSRDILKAMDSAMVDQLSDLVSDADTHGVPISTLVLHGRENIAVIRGVLKAGYDMVIRPVDGKWSNEGTLGAKEIALLRKCPCPVWLIKSTDQRGYRQVLAAVDYEPENLENESLNQKIVQVAATLALAEFSELHIVHAWELPFESFLRSPRSGLSNLEVDAMASDEYATRRRWLTGLTASLDSGEDTGVAKYLKPVAHFLEGMPHEMIPKCAEELGAELLVLGTVGRSGVPGLVIGNTAETILRKVRCSVLAIKPAGFVSPVQVES